MFNQLLNVDRRVFHLSISSDRTTQYDVESQLKATFPNYIGTQAGDEITLDIGTNVDLSNSGAVGASTLDAASLDSSC